MPHHLLLDLLGGIALLVFATRMVKTGILRAFEEPLRGVVQRATRSRIRGLFAGIGVAAALQSSTAAGLLVVSFAERAMLPLAAALAVMLGADIGSTLVVQALSFDLSAASPVLILGGVLLFLNGTSPRARQVGRIAIGLGLMIMALKTIVAASGPIRESPALDALIAGVGEDGLVTALLAALITWLVHSSVAAVLLFMSLAASGAVPTEVAIALVLGANIGSGLIPLGLTLRAGPAARRVLVGNLAFRLAGAAVALAALPALAPALVGLGFSPAATVAGFHTGFNILLALVFLPLTGVAAGLLDRLVPDPVAAPSPAQPQHLDAALLDRPALALGAATREVMRLADLVEVMLRDSILTFEPDPPMSTAAIAAQDNAIDALQEAIKIYLTRLTRGPLSDVESRRAFDLIVFTTNLEHVGDIIDKSLIPLAEKKRRQHLAFSDRGWREIRDLHLKVLEQMRLAVTVFVTQDPAMARDLIVHKDEIRAIEKRAFASHLERLRDGAPETVDSSAVHLDVIRDLKRINAHVAVAAHPILEEAGLIGRSRLREAG